jgi:hypothetical protein
MRKIVYMHILPIIQTRRTNRTRQEGRGLVSVALSLIFLLPQRLQNCKILIYFNSNIRSQPMDESETSQVVQSLGTSAWGGAIRSTPTRTMRSGKSAGSNVRN